MARGATFVFIQGFLNAAFGVLYVWFLLHTKEITGQVLFTESDFGLFTMLSFILTFASTLGVLALRSAAVKYIAHYLAGGKREEAKSVIARILQVSVVTSLITLVVLLVLAGLFADIFTASILIFQLLPMSAAIQIFYFQAQGFLQGLQKMRELSIISILFTIAQYTIAITLVYAGFGVLGIVISWLIAIALATLLSFLATFRYIEFTKHTHEFNPLLKFSLPIQVSAILTLIVGWLDQIFVFPFLGLEALGVYNLAVRASVVASLVSVAIITPLFPKLSELYSTFGVEGLRNAFKTSTRYGAFLGFPASLLVATLAYPLIVLFATVRFVDAVIPLAIMCIATLPATLGLAIIPIFLTLERTKMASLITVISIILEGLLAYVSLAYLNGGLTGVALSRFFAALVAFALGAYVLFRSLGIEFDKEAIWKAAAASVIMVVLLLAMEFVRSILEHSSFQFLVLRLRLLPVYAVVGVVVYLLTLMALKAVRRRDIELLRDYLPAKMRWVADLFSCIARIRE